MDLDPGEEEVEVQEANQSTMEFLRDSPDWLAVWRKATSAKPTKKIILSRSIATLCSELKAIACHPRPVLSFRVQCILLYGCTLTFEIQMKDLCRAYKFILVDKMGPLNKMALSKKESTTKSVTLPDAVPPSLLPVLEDLSDLAQALDTTILEPDTEDKYCVKDESLISLRDDPPSFSSLSSVDPAERFGDEGTGGFKGVEELEHPEWFDTASSEDQSMDVMADSDSSLLQVSINFNYKPAAEYLTSIRIHLPDRSDACKTIKTSGGFVLAVPDTPPVPETEEEAEERRNRYRIKSSSKDTLKRDAAAPIIKHSSYSKFDQFVLEPIDDMEQGGHRKRRKKPVSAIDVIKEIPAMEYERDDKPLYLRSSEPLIKKVTSKELFQGPTCEILALPHFRVIWDKLLNSPKASVFFNKTEQKATSTVVDKSVEFQRKITETASIDGPSELAIQSHVSGESSIMQNSKKSLRDGVGGVPGRHRVGELAPIPDEEEPSSIDNIDASHGQESLHSYYDFNCPFENKLRKRLRENDECLFQDLVPVSTPRAKAASEFLDMLTLLNDGIISAKQLEGSYTPISLSKGRHF
ncbi:PREDICTED: uncharacterized protein LOC109593766 isoform X2 [Amphimedon queenslandica]|uniref:Uncharacterized protein n=1 Tax=Amphimedon queenslandica TaxID=400682 RepID=A0A1X7VMS8_AMPQE|nr:PREDICTED: uncharacterized protein LOC109593766 isoform X2 [Amphimedon queenslandica]|eukprot:XP_019864399.1 PREDICTED: uncharacterized protein LOC109593766 isoform X2 [Amphimedon queenslandica]